MTPRVWFYKPSLYWCGSRTLLPIQPGHDEHARWTIVLGWTITGHIVVAVKKCRNEDCERDALDWKAMLVA